MADLPSALVNEGLKTLGLEIGEQLAERHPGVAVIIDGAEEGLPEAVLEGLAQLKDVGMIRTVPRLVIANGHTDASEHIEGRGALQGRGDRRRSGPGQPGDPPGAGPRQSTPMAPFRWRRPARPARPA